MTDPHQIIAGLQQASACLHLDTTDLCFLVALRLRADREGLAALEEEHLYDVYEQVCDLTEPGAANPRKRATHALQRLRDQRLMGRVDGAGLVRAGEYSLTRLGIAIVDFFLEEEVLTRENLAILTRTLISQLSEIKGRARDARTEDEWRREVMEPLRVTVADLVDGIERRQRGLDARQQEVRARIVELLQRGWFEAVEACEELLEDTVATLRELNQVLLQDAAMLQTLLQEIEQIAIEDATPVIRRVMENVDRMAAWGGVRLLAWSEYFQFVQRYLRSVVRLDPDRALSMRLRDQLGGWTDRPFFLVAADHAPCTGLREIDAKAARPAVTRPREEREHDLQEVEADDAVQQLEERVRASRAATLSDLLAEVLPAIPAPDRYRNAGRAAAIAARHAKIPPSRERSWVPVAGMEVEEWTLGR